MTSYPTQERHDSTEGMKDIPKVGDLVRTLVDFPGVPKGTLGVVDEDYGSGIMVAWNLSERPLPPNYTRYNGVPACVPGSPLRDGFDKRTELHFLEIVCHSTGCK